MDDASYRDTSGTSTFTKAETAAVTTKLSQCGRIFKQINSAQLGRFLKFQNGFTGKIVFTELTLHVASKSGKIAFNFKNICVQANRFGQNPNANCSSETIYT